MDALSRCERHTIRAMTNRLELLRMARTDMQTRIEQIADDHWDLPTPCDEWSVRDLITHLVVGTIMTVELLRGASAEDALVSSRAANLGDDLAASFVAASDIQEAAFAEPGALERICHHRLGDMTGDQVLGLRLTDLAGHAWDLSRAIDIDETLEPRVISAIWEQIQPLIPILPSTGVFAAPEGDIADDASTQAKLLHVLGRKG